MAGSLHCRPDLVLALHLQSTALRSGTGVKREELGGTGVLGSELNCRLKAGQETDEAVEKVGEGGRMVTGSL